MPDLSALKPLFSELSFEERVALVKRLRKARRDFVDTRKAPKAAKPKAKDVSVDVTNLFDVDKEALLKALMAQLNEAEDSDDES